MTETQLIQGTEIKKQIKENEKLLKDLIVEQKKLDKTSKGGNLIHLRSNRESIGFWLPLNALEKIMKDRISELEEIISTLEKQFAAL